MTAWRAWTADEDAWDAALARLPDANVFQSSAWARHKADFGWRAVRLAAGPADSPAAAIQALVKDAPGGGRLLWARGGPLGDRTLWDADLQDALARAAGGWLAYGRVCSYRELDAEAETRMRAKGWARPERPLDRNQTYFVDLTPEPPALMDGLSSNWRHNLKRGNARSVVVDWPDPDPAEMEAVYREMESLKGLPPQHRADELASLVKALGGRMILKRAMVDGRIVALRACALFGDAAVDLLAAANADARKVYASYALLWSLLLEARARGARTYDLGGADPDAARGVADFKKGVGGRLAGTVGEWDFARPAALRRPAGAMIAWANVGRPDEGPAAARRMLPGPAPALRRVWMKFIVGIDASLYADDWKRLGRAYALEDPWGMDSPAEKFRYEKIDALIARELGSAGSILEIGSGEGHHTRRLLERAKRVDALEVSPSAIERARKRCPNARFFEAAFPDAPAELEPPYDLVVASEALYYLKDVTPAIAAMEKLGRSCLVTFYNDQAARLAPHFKDIPGVKREVFSYDSATWQLYFWTPAGAGAPR